MKCCVCNRDWPEAQCHIVHLTEAEKRTIQELGLTPEPTLAYCRPCWQVLSDRMMGAQLIKGTMQVQLKSSNVPGAEHTAQAMFDGLLKIRPKS